MMQEREEEHWSNVLGQCPEERLTLDRNKESSSMSLGEACMWVQILRLPLSPDHFFYKSPSEVKTHGPKSYVQIEQNVQHLASAQ